uniref:Secreted protein n=1 Tax=Cyprinodon variegatus TaxID=28743 RepID=A0A3Q2D236_CYPVA
MCTTMMVLTTIAVLLRQRFSNKIKPGCGHGHAIHKEQRNSGNNRMTTSMGKNTKANQGHAFKLQCLH